MAQGLVLSDFTKQLLLWVSIAMVLVMVFNSFSTNQQQAVEVGYSDFLDDVEAGNVFEVMIDARVITGTYRDGQREFWTSNPETENTELIEVLRNNNVKIKGAPPERLALILI